MRIYKSSNSDNDIPDQVETNTIIRTEDSINMGGSFLNETQVRPRVRDPTLSQSYEGTLPPCRHKSGVIITTYLLWPGAQSVYTHAAPTPCVTL